MPGAEPDALVAAVLHQQPIQRLLRVGADPTVRDQAGLTPLHHAVLAGNVEAVEALLDHASKRTRPLRRPGGEPSRAPGSPWALATAPGPPPSRPSPLHLAAERSDTLLRIVLCHRSLTSVAASFLGIPISSRPQAELLHLRDARGWSLLHYAVSRANLATMRLLLPHMGASASDLGSSGSSRSSSAGGAPPAQPHAAAAVGCGVNVPDAAGRTSLHHAAHLGHADCCRLLLKTGADQSLASSPPEGALPLHLAAAGNHSAAIEVLFRHAVNQAGFRAAQTVLLRPNAAGLTALHVAVQHGAVDAARRLLLLVFPFDTRGPLGRTALHLAALLGDTPMISMLLGHSTPQQRQLRDAEGFAAIHLAAATGRLEALRVLAAGGCGVDSRAEAAPHAPAGCEGWTPLHCAVRRGDVATIELLISELGADPHGKDKGGRTPYDLAVAVAGDDSRAGSSVVGAGSGIQNLDDAQWATDATGTESEGGRSGGGGGSLERTVSATVMRGGSGTGVVGLAVDPLQGPSGVTAGLHGLNGSCCNGSGGGSTRLDEALALAVLQTFIRLLHEPMRRSGAASPLLGTLGGASTQSGGAAASPILQTHGSRATADAVGGGCEPGAVLGSPPKRSTPAVWEASPAAPLGDRPSGTVPPAPVALMDPGPHAGQHPPDGTEKGDGVAGGQAQLGSGFSSGAGRKSAAMAADAGPSPELVVSPAHAVATAEERNCDSAAQYANGESPQGKSDSIKTAAAKLDSHAHGHEAGPLSNWSPEAPPMALAFAVQMLAGPAATRTRASPFSKPQAKRTSPFQVSPAVTAAGASAAPGVGAPTAAATATGASTTTSAASADSRSATTAGSVVSATASGAAFAPEATRGFETSAVVEGAANGDGVASVTGPPEAAAEITTLVAAPAAAADPGAAAVPAATKRSPFVAKTRPSPFAAAGAAARPPPAPSPAAQLPPAQPYPQPQLDPQPEPKLQLRAEGGAAPAAPAAPAEAEAEALAPESAAPTCETPPAEPPSQQKQKQQPLSTPFATAVAVQQQGSGPTATLPPSGALPPPAPPSGDPATPSLCIVSAINSPCGYSALNRAILLQRHGLAEALLATLPPQGHSGGVLVLSGPAPGGGRMASTATVAYQPFNAANMGMQQQQLHPLPPTTSSSEANDGRAAGPRPVPSRTATARGSTGAAGASAVPLPPLGPSAAARPHTPTRQQPSHKLLHLQHQLSSGGQASPAHSDGPLSSGAADGTSSRIEPPLLPLRGPGGATPAFTAGPPPPPGSALIPGVLSWDEANEVFRSQPPNHTSRAWLHWPGEPDPSTGWLVAEMVVVEAGASGGHVWLGLGPTPELLAASTSSSSGSGSLAAGPSATTLGPTAAATTTAAPGGGLSPAGLTRSTTAGALLTAGAASGRGTAAAAGGPGGGVAGPILITMCPVINHPSTHVACLRDGQAFRGGVLTLDMGAAARLEARNGDTVALFWNRRGRSVAYTLNGRYCGRLSGLPAHAQLTPIVGLQCSGFVFQWRCYSRVASAGGSGVGVGFVRAPEPYTCPSCTSNIDGMLIREQMLHEDPETPWLCKPSMTSLHFAAWSGNVRVLPQLVRAKGFSPDDVDVDGWTPLHFAALAGQDEAVRLLLSYNCHPDRKSKYGSTPAMLAAKYGRSPEHVAIVRHLSDVGAVLDVRDPRGRTLLMLAARAGNLAMVQLLLERGLDPSATDALDREAQQYAGQHAAIFRLLRNAQAAQRAGARKGKRRQQAQRQEQQQTAAAAAVATAAAVAQAEPAGSAESDGEDDDEEEDDEDAADGAGVGRGRALDVQQLPLLAERWRVGAGQLVRGRLIEQGAFGAVFEGTWCGARVAIKQVVRRRRTHGSPRGGRSGGGDEEGEEEPEAAREAASLEREVAILAALPPHERIARMLGSVKLPREGVCLVMAYYPHTLQGVMQSERLRRCWLTPSRRASIARQLAEGLAFLHGLPGPCVIHRDLKPNNVLLEAAPSLGVKICDFGLSRILAGNDVQSSSAAGHAFWMAPELLRALPYDEKVDVYSYGVILYQLAYWVDDQLYGGLNKAQVDFQVVHGILRLQDRLPGGIDSAVQALVRDCVDENPRNRPSMARVLERLCSTRELPQPGTGHSIGGGAAAAAVATATAVGGAVEVAARQGAGGAEPELHRQG